MRAWKSDAKLTLIHWRDISWYMYTLVISDRLCFGICVVLFSSGIIVILILSNISNSIAVTYYAASYFFWKKKTTVSFKKLRVHVVFFSFKLGNMPSRLMEKLPTKHQFIGVELSKEKIDWMISNWTIHMPYALGFFGQIFRKPFLMLFFSF